VNHLLILPILLPLLAGALLLAAGRTPLPLRRVVNLLATAANLAVAVQLLLLADAGAVQGYLLGDWPAPFGIVLVLDRLAALMLLLTALLAAAALLYAIAGGCSQRGQFHALFQLQILGLNGAFLTGDLFNLFVFFEILLIASFGLLLHGHGPARTRAGLHYVILNLAGSSLFLIAIGLLYSLTGTLNLAHLSDAVTELAPAQQPLAASAGLLLLVVFGLKAAIPPLHFWLTPAYSAAAAPVAALFAIMTKVGIYAILRVFGLLFGDGAGTLSGLADPWLVPAGLLAIFVGTLGVLGGRDLRAVTGQLVIVSVGTLLLGLGLGTVEGVAAALYYLLHTTLVTAALFLIADLIAGGRLQGANLTAGEQPAAPRLLGGLFLLGAVAVIGMPPLSGLVGKLLILVAAGESPWMVWIWSGLLGSSLLLLLGLSRGGILLFWRGTPTTTTPPGAARLTPALLLLAGSPLLVLFGGSITGYTNATARQLADTTGYIEGVYRLAPVSPRIPLEAP